jgi:hypothetical protein
MYFLCIYTVESCMLLFQSKLLKYLLFLKWKKFSEINWSNLFCKSIWIEVFMTNFKSHVIYLYLNNIIKVRFYDYFFYLSIHLVFFYCTTFRLFIVSIIKWIINIGPELHTCMEININHVLHNSGPVLGT